jgi:hypothetical protein
MARTPLSGMDYRSGAKIAKSSTTTNGMNPTKSAIVITSTATRIAASMYARTAEEESRKFRFI